MTEKEFIRAIERLEFNAIALKQIGQMTSILWAANPCEAIQPASKKDCEKYGFDPLSPESYLLKVVLDKVEELKK